MVELGDIAIGAIPLVSGFATSALFPIPRERGGAVVVARPPARAFGGVWFVLYVLMGVAWVLARSHPREKTEPWPVDASLGALTAVLCSWVWVYSRSDDPEWHRASVWVIVLAIILSYVGLVVTSARNTTSAVLLCPLTGWLYFAFSILFAEVQHRPGLPQPTG